MDPEVLADHRQVRSLSIKRAATAPLVEQFRALQAAETTAEELDEVIAAGSDEDLVAIAREELPIVHEQLATLGASIQASLVTVDDAAIGSLIIEIRAGVGGDEAALFAGDLEEMYGKYAAQRGWSVELLERSAGEAGGCKSVIIAVSGEGAWTALGFEGGTHQVKRVPATEAQGRVHTSTATVAVLPEPEEVEIDLNAADVQENITTATGPGGQNVNKVATAVHLIHEPTGIEVRMQDTKSQAQNRQKAWKLLRARIFEQQKAAADAERAEARASMIGSASRAEKIRTYRFKDNLVVDHRVGQSFNLGEFLAGNMQPVVDQLIEAETARRLAAM